MLLIILAHTKGLNSDLFLLREFDVCLFVLISGYFFSYKQNISFKTQITKRFLRLVVPVWFFLFLYFLGYSVFASLGMKYTEISLSMMLGSFSLINGIGYVWIIRVFLIVSIVLSITLYLNNTFSKLVSSMWLFFVFFVYFVVKITNPSGILWYYLILEPIPYLFLFFSGFLFKKTVGVKTTLKPNFIILCCSLVILFVALFVALFLGYMPVKYPPNAMYLLYGFSVSFLLFSFFLTRNCNNLLLAPIVLIGQFSMPIYLWHIPMAKYFEKTATKFSVLIQFSSMLISGILFTFILIILFKFLFGSKSSLLIKRYIG